MVRHERGHETGVDRDEPRPGSSMLDRLRRHRRQYSFACVGLLALGLGFAVLAILVQGLGVDPQLAFFAQAVVAIESNFLLNQRFTWRDRPVRSRREIARRWLRFHATRAVSVPLNQLAFMLLISTGAGWLLSSCICVAGTMIVNYLAGDRWVFRLERPEAR
jgi:putative flippase GtrA